MPRVLIAGFCSLPAPDRAGVQLQHVVRALVRSHSVDVLVVRRGDQAYVERFSGARLLRVPVPDGDLRAQIDAFRRALRRQIEGADYDIVHFRDGWSGVPVLGMQERLRFATVFDVARSPMTEPVLGSRELAAEAEQDDDQCLRRADMVLAPTEPARRTLAAELGQDRVHLVPPGVDVDQFDWEDTEPRTPPRILYMGSLDPGRGVRVLLRAMLDVAQHSDAHLVIAGRAPREFVKSLKTAVHDLGLANRVEFPGEIDHDDVAAYIAAATVCVAPGAVELAARPTALYPTKVLEYMACRRPVIAPRRTTMTMMMRDEQHGLLFEPGQPSHLAEQIMRLLADAKLRERLARAGYDLVRRMYTASGTRRELRKAYNWLAMQSVWRERFLEGLDEVPTVDSLPIASEVTDASYGSAKATPEFESEEIVIDEDTESRHVGHEVGEITRVEEIAIASAGESSMPSIRTIPAARREDWVIEDSRRRPPRLPVRTDVDAPAPRARRSSTDRHLENRFVAGELEVPAPGREPRVEGPEVDVGGMFTALEPVLGPPEAAPAKPEPTPRPPRVPRPTEPDATLPPTDKHKPLSKR